VVVECGFGAGRNLEHYPPEVTEVIAIEPSPYMRSKASPQIDAAGIPVRWGGLDGQHLDLPDASADHAVVTFTLCTIPDPLAALHELRRVVRAGGELRVLEHGLAPEAGVAKWQHRLNGFEMVVADGCQLIRDPTTLVTESGWVIAANYQRFAPGPKPWSYLTSLKAH
jgi:ubiquinone/menaquinone biosynthesis C-methylase UbiE